MQIRKNTQIFPLIIIRYTILRPMGHLYWLIRFKLVISNPRPNLPLSEELAHGYLTGLLESSSKLN